jgi:hypothetical protein
MPPLPKKHRDIPPEGYRDVHGGCANILPADLTGLRDLSGLDVETAAPRGCFTKAASTEKQIVFRAKIGQNAQIKWLEIH